jgi:sporulation protein YlmC with PRC-barrel domain
MEIPLNAQVECTDSVCGRSVFVLLDPILANITHLVIRETPSSREYIVPIKFVSKTIAGTIQLRCSKAEFEKVEPFIKTIFIEENVPERYYSYDGNMYGRGSYFFIPYVITGMKMQVPVKKQQVPPGELAVRRGTRVEAADGFIGHVDEFVVNPRNGHITDLVLREGHLWGQKEVIIPVSVLKDVRQDTVFLKLAKRQVEAFPSFPLLHRWM